MLAATHVNNSKIVRHLTAGGSLDCAGRQEFFSFAVNANN
jgi:hypothetical protein